MIHAVGTALGEIIRNLRRTVRLTLYENRSRRAGMLLGRWWDLLSPLLQILIYWFVFSVGLGTQEKNGFPYHLWLMCGMMPWLALNSAILGASASIQQAASIIRNVRIPLSIIPMKAVVRAYYEHLWTMAILLIALLLGGVPVTWHYLELAYYLAASWVLLIGAALLAWKLSKGFKDGLTKFVGLLVAIRGGIDLAKGAWDAWQNGVSMDNFLEMLKGAAELTLGLWIAFGKLGAGIGMVVSGLSLFATGLHDALKNGWNFENMLSTVAGLLISGLGIAVLTGSWIPLLVAAIAGLLLVFTNAFGQGQVMLAGIKLLLEGFLEFFKGIFTGDLTLTINGIQLLVQGLQTIVEAVLTALQTAVDTFFTWLDEQTNGRLSGLIEWIRTTLNSWIETLKLTLKNLVSSIGQILTGIVTFVSGVFTGKWRQAWEGVKDIFRGIWNTIVDLLEGGINFIIDGINAFIRGVNKAFALIGALTGRSVSIDTLPRVELPRLATGAVIPPNKEFLAVLGDQKQGTNIETPLDTMVQAFRQALSEGGYSGQSTAYLVIDEDILGKVVYRLNKSESNRVGVSLEDY